jgi:hypothetical protein
MSRGPASEGWCDPACDFCEHYDFNGDEDGVYTGDGWCRLHKRPEDPDSYCEDYLCKHRNASWHP